MPVELPHVNGKHQLNYQKWAQSPGLTGNAGNEVIGHLAVINPQAALNLRYLQSLKLLDDLMALYINTIPTNSQDIALLIKNDITHQDEQKIIKWKNAIITDYDILKKLPQQVIGLLGTNLPIMTLEIQGRSPQDKIDYYKLLLISYIKFNYRKFIADCYDELTQWYTKLSNPDDECRNNQMLRAAIETKLLPDNIWIQILNRRAKHKHHAYYIDVHNHYQLMYKWGRFKWHIHRSNLNKLFPNK